MRSVQRSPEPDFWGDIWAARREWIWDDLRSNERQQIRNALADLDFGPVCAYCQQSCQEPEYGTRKPNKRNDATIDHFEPLDSNPLLWLDWPNLIYACHRCNQAKDNKWPYEANLSVRGYVSPNVVEGQRTAQEFFDFDFKHGKIRPAEHLDDAERRIACQTIRDLDLNDLCLGIYDESNLLNLRRNQLTWLIEVLIGIEDLREKAYVLQSFMLPNMPFSSFVSSYVHARPSLRELVQELSSDPIISSGGNQS